jgi:tetratricopeptide (TPR) repeat protein
VPVRLQLGRTATLQHLSLLEKPSRASFFKTHPVKRDVFSHINAAKGNPDQRAADSRGEHDISYKTGGTGPPWVQVQSLLHPIRALARAFYITLFSKRSEEVVSTRMERKEAAQSLVEHAWRLIVGPDESRLPEAIECLDKAISLDFYHEYAWYWKGVALTRLKRWFEAYGCFSTSVVVDRDFPESWWEQGECLLALDKPREAITAFHTALLHFSDPNPRSRSTSYVTFRQLLGSPESIGEEEWKQLQKLYKGRGVMLTIEALATAYSKLCYFEKACVLLHNADAILKKLNLPIPDNMNKIHDRALRLHDAAHNLGTRLTLILPADFPDPHGTFSKNDPELHEALRKALACDFKTAFQVFREKISPDSDVMSQLLFATLLLGSVPYRQEWILQKQGITAEERKQWLQEAKQILGRMLEKKEVAIESQETSILRAALNNKAVAVIQLSNYAQTLEEIHKAYQEACETFKFLVERKGGPDSAEANLTESTSTRDLLLTLLNKKNKTSIFAKLRRKSKGH